MWLLQQICKIFKVVKVKIDRSSTGGAINMIFLSQTKVDFEFLDQNAKNQKSSYITLAKSRAHTISSKCQF